MPAGCTSSQFPNRTLLPCVPIRDAWELMVRGQVDSVLHSPQAQLDLSITEPQNDPVRDAVDGLNPDTMTPRDALDALYKLKDL